MILALWLNGGRERKCLSTWPKEMRSLHRGEKKLSTIYEDPKRLQRFHNTPGQHGVSYSKLHLLNNKIYPKKH